MRRRSFIQAALTAFALGYAKPLGLERRVEVEQPRAEASQGRIYVSARGHDERNDGSKERPYATFRRAVRDRRAVMDYRDQLTVTIHRAGLFSLEFEEA